MPLREVGIETVYLDGNRSSHFNPLLDSVKIYSLLLRLSLPAGSTRGHVFDAAWRATGAFGP